MSDDESDIDNHCRGFIEWWERIGRREAEIERLRLDEQTRIFVAMGYAEDELFTRCRWVHAGLCEKQIMPKSML